MLRLLNTRGWQKEAWNVTGHKIEKTPGEDGFSFQTIPILTFKKESEVANQLSSIKAA